MTTALEVIILAAGQGKRMYSRLPKVLHTLAGRPLLAHVLSSATELDPSAIHVVYGHGGEQVRTALADARVNWALQAEQKGTGHAVMQALPAIADDATVLILYGDVPLIAPATLQALVSASGPNTLALLTAELSDPGAYGRILRDSGGHVTRIVEAKDASDEESRVREVNTGFLAVPAAPLKRWVAALRNHNAQGEYYLTDVIAMAVAEGMEIATRAPRALWEILGVNSKIELASLERTCQMNRAQELLQQGVTLRDPARIDVRGSLSCGRDVLIDVNVVFEGTVTLADGVEIGPNNVLRDVSVGRGTRIEANCVLEKSIIGAECRIGPFARLRPGAQLADHVHIGNFVEVKKSEIGEGSKANHLSYIGDTTIGKGVNVGAGTITCNYDGANKHRTVIGDNAFIGSNTALVAPVTVGDGATIGAGSVIAREAPPGELTLTRAEQKTVRGWKRPIKKKKD
jgi:bifunctional UDP-N-acetylglucosamine pyrophosphorylase/glucosamine-1-phosphate N-acetyltransferase